MKDISTLDDIKLMVDSFYASVRSDGLIGPIFNERIGDRWPEHLSKMYRFWQTILLEEHTYSGAPFAPHATMPIAKEHFSRWVLLFNTSIDRSFCGEKADEAKMRAGKMAELFQIKRAHIEQGGFKNIL